MVVDQLDVTNAMLLEAEDDALIGRHADSPESLEVAFQWVRPPLRVASQCRRSADRGQYEENSLDLRDVLGREAARIVLLEKPSQPGILEEARATSFDGWPNFLA